MRGIFFRHVLRHVSLSTLAVGIVLLVVLFTYQLAFVLGRAADGQLPGALVLQLVALTLRGNLILILPFALLLGIVMGLGRLYHDNEIAAAQACGVTTRTLLAAAGTATSIAAAVAAWIVFIDGPDASRRVVQLRTEALRTAVTRGLAPGQFRSLGHGTTLYFRSINADGTLRDAFLQRDLPVVPGEARRMQIMLADEARYAVTPDGNFYVITLAQGHSYEGVPGSASWRITRSGQQVIRVPTAQARLPGRPRVDVLDTGELLSSGNARFNGELHWRVAWVLDVIVLGLLAVPLARLRPGQGRHARLAWAVLLFATYAGLLIAGRNMLERGDVPASLGLWWVHALVLIATLALLQMPRLGATIRRMKA